MLLLLNDSIDERITKETDDIVALRYRCSWMSDFYVKGLSSLYKLEVNNRFCNLRNGYV